MAPLSSGTNPDELFRQFEPVILSHGREDRKQLLDSFIHKIEDNAFTTKDPQWRKEDEVLFLVWRHDLDEWFESWLMHDDVLLKIVNELTNLYDLTAMHQKRMRDGRDMVSFVLFRFQAFDPTLTHSEDTRTSLKRRKRRKVQNFARSRPTSK